MYKRLLSMAAIGSALVWGGSNAWAAAFSDVPTTSPFSTYIQDLQSLGITDGIASGQFGPQLTLTRGQFAKFVAVAFQLKDNGSQAPFQDTQGHWAQPYVSEAWQAGLVNGTSETTFSPDASVTREEAATMVWRYAKSKGIAPSPAARLATSPDSWAQEAVDSAIGHRWFGADVAQTAGVWSYRPRDPMTRQEMAALLDTTMKNVPGSLRTPPASTPNRSTSDPAVPSSAPAVTLASWQQALHDHLTSRDENFSIELDDAAEFSQIKAYAEQVLHDDDYLHYIYDGMNYSFDGASTVTFHVRYLETRQQSQYVATQTQAIVDQLLKPGMTLVDKEKAIHDYIVTHVAYDNSLTDHTAYGALTKGTTVCQGYALLTWKMLTEAGIENHIVEGDAGGQLHTWNIVRLDDGNWYHLDTTWDDPVPDKPGRVLYDYFNLTDKQIKQTHTFTGDYPAATTDFTGLAQKEPALLAELGLTAETPAFTADTSATAVAILQRELNAQSSEVRFRYKSLLGSASTLVKLALADLNMNVSVSYSNSPDTRAEGYTIIDLKPTYGG